MSIKGKHSRGDILAYVGIILLLFFVTTVAGVNKYSSKNINSDIDISEGVDLNGVVDNGVIIEDNGQAIEESEDTSIKPDGEETKTESEEVAEEVEEPYEEVFSDNMDTTLDGVDSDKIIEVTESVGGDLSEYEIITIENDMVFKDILKFNSTESQRVSLGVRGVEVVDGGIRLNYSLIAGTSSNDAINTELLLKKVSEFSYAMLWGVYDKNGRLITSDGNHIFSYHNADVSISSVSSELKPQVDKLDKGIFLNNGDKLNFSITLKCDTKIADNIVLSIGLVDYDTDSPMGIEYSKYSLKINK